MSPNGRRQAGFTLAVLGDIHGNADALEAAVAAIDRVRPDAIAITGDLVMNGPRPSEVVSRVRALEAAGAYVISGNTDIAVTDGDYGAAFPWFDIVPGHYRAAAEWAREQLSDADLDWLRRLPAERRLWIGDELVLVCHASPGSQTDGLAPDLDAAVTVQRISRTDARVIVCGHTHLAEVRDFGRRLLVNPGSCGYAFDGDPGAAWALLSFDAAVPAATTAAGVETSEPAPTIQVAAIIDAEPTARPTPAPPEPVDILVVAEAALAEDEVTSIDGTVSAEDDGAPDDGAPDDGAPDDRETASVAPASIRAELRRAAYDPLPAADEVSRRGLPGDVYRAASIRTGRYVR
jgi:putative phosphoesterase